MSTDYRFTTQAEAQIAADRLSVRAKTRWNVYKTVFRKESFYTIGRNSNEARAIVARELGVIVEPVEIPGALDHVASLSPEEAAKLRALIDALHPQTK